MNIKKCNRCGRILTKKDDYFSIGEIEFHKGNSKGKGVSVHFSNNDRYETYNMSEGWVCYADLDFCPDCWEHEKLSKYVEDKWNTAEK